jgi:hypothetical protein
MYDKSITPWKIERLHVVFDVWSDDDLLRTSPCYFITVRLSEALHSSNFSGIKIGPEVETEASLTFKGLYPDKNLPRYYLLRIDGNAFKDDFGLDKSNKLIISERAKQFLTGFNLSDSEIEEVK